MSGAICESDALAALRADNASHCHNNDQKDEPPVRGLNRSWRWCSANSKQVH